MASAAVAKVQLHAKDFAATAMHNGKIVGLLAIGTVVSQKFLDFEAIAKRIKPDMKTDTMLFKHQGAIKLVGGIAALHIWGKKMPDWAKWLVIAVMLQGGLQELNTLTGGKTGQIGDAELDQQMKDAAEEIKNAMLNGTEEQVLGVTEQYASTVSGVTEEYPSSVAGYLDVPYGGAVAGWETFGNA